MLTSFVDVPGCNLECSEQSLLADVAELFPKKPVPRHQLERFEQAAEVKTYKNEGEELCEHVSRIQVADICADANVIRGHIVSKLKRNREVSLMLKARIAPHSNENNQKPDLRTECFMCSPSEVHILLAVSATGRWRIDKANARSTFSSRGCAPRGVYVVQPLECNSRSH